MHYHVRYTNPEVIEKGELGISRCLPLRLPVEPWVGLKLRTATLPHTDLVVTDMAYTIIDHPIEPEYIIELTIKKVDDDEAGAFLVLQGNDTAGEIYSHLFKTEKEAYDYVESEASGITRSNVIELPERNDTGIDTEVMVESIINELETLK